MALSWVFITPVHPHRQEYCESTVLGQCTTMWWWTWQCIPDHREPSHFPQHCRQTWQERWLHVAGNQDIYRPTYTQEWHETRCQGGYRWSRALRPSHVQGHNSIGHCCLHSDLHYCHHLQLKILMGEVLVEDIWWPHNQELVLTIFHPPCIQYSFSLLDGNQMGSQKKLNLWRSYWEKSL